MSSPDAPDAEVSAAWATTGAAGSHDRGRILEALAGAGAHPLMWAFPRGVLFAFDADLRYLCAGGQHLEVAGLSRGAMEGRTLFEVFPQETAARVAPLYRAALQGRSIAQDVPFGDRVYEMRLAPVADSTGSVVAGMGFTQDVTEARASQRRLRESEERTRLTFEYAPIGQAIVALDGRWRAVNSALTRLVGYSEEQLMGMTFQDITHPDDLDPDLSHLQDLLDGQITSYQMEKRYLTATGDTAWALLSVSLAREETGEPLYFISQIEDITERVHQQQALTDLTSMLTHDLRTKTTIVSTCAEVLSSDYDLTAEERDKYAARIGSAAQSMASILDNTRVAASAESGQLRPEPHRVPLAPAIREVVDNLSSITRLRFDLSDLDESEAWVDRVHLGQVLTNLLTNANKYGGERVDVRTYGRDGHVVVTVFDDGDGVAPEFVPHLFERHSRSVSARNGEHSGSGIGLHIVKALMRINGGDVTYVQPAQGGAQFTLRLPRPPSLHA